MDVEVKETLYHHINGERVQGTSGRFGDIYNPAFGTVVKQAPYADAQEVGAAVNAAGARHCLAGLRPRPVAGVQVLFSFRDKVRNRMDELAEVISAEHGKTLADAKGSISRGLEVVEFACGIPQLLKGEMSEQVARGVGSYSIRQPVGVCAGNHPV